LGRGLDALVLASTAQHAQEKPIVPWWTYVLALFRYALIGLIVYVIFVYRNIPLASMILDCVLWQRQQSRQVCGKSSLFGISDGRIRRWHNEICEPSAGPAVATVLAKLPTAFHPTDPSLPILNTWSWGCWWCSWHDSCANHQVAPIGGKAGALQQVAELLLTNPMGIRNQGFAGRNVHHGAAKLVPFVGSISISFCCQI